ncbi:MAG: dihydroneopterin aldolase [Zoogloeaceae bacterium]|jgi:dihydroneopterin aldolase|nr:dihydroneopterin aldolase [Zoogloeaceae bacterium]
MDIIFIEALRLKTWIGIYPREKAMPQTVVLDLEISHLPLDGATDDLHATIDYAAVVARLKTELAERHFNLLETLAEWIAALVLTEFSAAQVRVRIAKLGVLKDVGRVGVQIERQAISR